jgi:hypothetical protein
MFMEPTTTKKCHGPKAIGAIDPVGTALPGVGMKGVKVVGMHTI